MCHTLAEHNNLTTIIVANLAVEQARRKSSGPRPRVVVEWTQVHWRDHNPRCLHWEKRAHTAQAARRMITQTALCPCSRGLPPVQLQQYPGLCAHAHLISSCLEVLLSFLTCTCPQTGHTICKSNRGDWRDRKPRNVHACMGNRKPARLVPHCTEFSSYPWMPRPLFTGKHLLFSAPGARPAPPGTVSADSWDRSEEATERKYCRIWNP